MFGRVILLVVLMFCFIAPVYANELSSVAEGVFKKYSPAIYQIQSISNHSNKKYTIGSGFQISKEGYVVTNYHVVSDVVLYPESFHIVAIQSNGKEQGAEIIGFDVIHDIAIVKVKDPQEVELPMGSSEINKGKKLFSIGNPEDVGMMIIEGASNGYMEKALYKKVLTSLPLNPGMSGGPTLDEEGMVVGINVMTAGNSLSFLVPVEFLRELWQKIEAKQFKAPSDVISDMQAQLIAQEESYFKKIIATPWEKQRFGDFVVPSIISNEISCWGAPRNDTEYWIETPYLSCNIKDDLFISSSVRAHTVVLNYASWKSRSFDPLRFYSLANQSFLKSYKFDLNQVYERDADNFKCTTDIVNISSKPFWISTCSRKLKKLTQLYDISIRMASLGDMDRLLMVELTLGAMTKETLKAFLNKFYKEITWVK